jgi:hypothetical protein
MTTGIQALTLYSALQYDGVQAHPPEYETATIRSILCAQTDLRVVTQPPPLRSHYPNNTAVRPNRKMHRRFVIIKGIAVISMNCHVQYVPTVENSKAIYYTLNNSDTM